MEEGDKKRKGEKVYLNSSLVSSRDLGLSLDQLPELGNIVLDLLPICVQPTTRKKSVPINSQPKERRKNETHTS